jgi:hypothetical protein
VVTTKLWLVLFTELVPQFPVPPVDAAVTVNTVVPAGVAVVVEIVRVEVAALLATVVGPKTAVAPVGAVQLIVSGAEVQTAPPDHVVVIE